MEEYTWIGLPRCFTTVSFYKDSRCILLFCYLLLKAEREDSWLGKSITKRGEINISSRKLETILGMSRQNIRAALSKLQEERAIFCECKKGKTSKISITNFDKFLSIYNYEGGWIKLYDDFTGQRWFYNPFLFHLYLHINLKFDTRQGLQWYSCLVRSRKPVFGNRYCSFGNKKDFTQNE